MSVIPKKTATKTTVKKATSTKKPTVKKTAPKKASAKKSNAPKSREISAEERYKMIEVAAYYIAEHNHFQGNAIDFWIAAEQEVNQLAA